MYLAGEKRDEDEARFEGSKEAFLASLEMVLTLFPAGQDDLDRAEELTVRTHQLNATGRTYSRDALDRFRRDPGHLLLMAELRDRYGSYGRVGLALVERRPAAWTIKMLLASCRVISRGVGGVLLSHIINQARRAGVGLQAEFVPTDRNRMLLVTYRFSGFEEAATDDGVILLRHPLSAERPFPGYMRVILEGGSP
jgi:FkbH-like protein